MMRPLEELMDTLAATASTFMGMQVRASEGVEPGQAAVVRMRGEQVVLMHPTLIHAFEMVKRDPSRHVSDPDVMVTASVLWQWQVIENAEERAVSRLHLLMLQQDQRRLQREQDEELARRLRVAHQGRPHDWHRNVMARTAACRSCGVTITEESAERLGVELPVMPVPGGRLSILVDDEWQEVRGVGPLSILREDGAR